MLAAQHTGNAPTMTMLNMFCQKIVEEAFSEYYVAKTNDVKIVEH